MNCQSIDSFAGIISSVIINEHCMSSRTRREPSRLYIELVEMYVRTMADNLRLRYFDGVYTELSRSAQHRLAQPPASSMLPLVPLREYILSIADILGMTYNNDIVYHQPLIRFLAIDRIFAVSIRLR